jgi:protein-S-isoprenylcysteine O-methyltransferase Ste14
MTGPYAIVRHPMYGGAILFLFGTPLLLGSAIGLVFASILVVLLAIRSVLEERALAASFPEYAVYWEKVRYRFVPHVW